MASTLEPWWVIGSAAMALHGLDVPVANVDLLLSADDAAQVLEDSGCHPSADGGTECFRSDVFGRIDRGPLPIDVLGGFHVRLDGCWARVQLATRPAISLGGGTVHVPSRPELATLTRSLGRPSDVLRADLLDALP